MIGQEPVTPTTETPASDYKEYDLNDVRGRGTGTGFTPSGPETPIGPDGEKLNQAFGTLISGITCPFDGADLFQRPRTRDEFNAALQRTLVPMLTMLRFEECFLYAGMLPLAWRAGIGLGLIATFVYMYHPAFGKKKKEEPEKPKEAGSGIQKEAAPMNESRA